jgi:hypothetical protein
VKPLTKNVINLEVKKLEEWLKSFRGEVREKPLREVRKRLRVRAYKSKYFRLSSNFVDYINYN